MGPLKTERFRLAKTGRPGEAGAVLALPNALASEKAGKVPRDDGGGRRETRIPEGNAGFVGVAGRTLTELCGDLPCREPEAVLKPEGLAILVLEVDEAFESVC